MGDTFFGDAEKQKKCELAWAKQFFKKFNSFKAWQNDSKLRPTLLV